MFIATLQIGLSAPGFTIGNPNSCGTGTIDFTRTGVYGKCFDLSNYPSVPTITNLRYQTVHHMSVVDASTNLSVYYRNTFSDISNIPVITGGEPWVKCGWVSYADALPPLLYQNSIPDLEPGIDEIYIWDEVAWSANYNGIPIMGSFVHGSNVTPHGSIQITIDDTSQPFGNLDKVVIDGVTAINAPHIVTDCKPFLSVDFHVDNVSPMIGNLYSVTASWAEVNDCFQSTGALSSETSSSLFIFNNEVLRLGNILDANVLINNPFLDSNNIGKYFKVKFVLNHPHCTSEEIELCFYMSEKIQNVNFELKECREDSFPNLCSDFFVQAETSPPGPMLGWNTNDFKLSAPNAIFNKLLIFIKSEDQTPHFIHWNILDIPPNFFRTDNIFDRRIDNLIQNGNLEDLSDQGYNNFKIELYLANSCAKCFAFDEAYFEENFELLEVPCDFETRFEEATGSSNSLLDVIFEPMVFEVENHLDAYTYSYFRTDPDIKNMPVSGFNGEWHTEKEDFSVYPNPFSHEITLSNHGEAGVFHFISSDGKVIMSQDIPANGAPSYHVPQLKSGVYLYQFINKQGVVSGKLIKQ